MSPLQCSAATEYRENFFRTTVSPRTLSPTPDETLFTQIVSNSYRKASCWCRWRWKKGPKQRWSGYFFTLPLSLLEGVLSQNGPQRSRARRCCAAKRTLDGEDRSEILVQEGKGRP